MYIICLYFPTWRCNSAAVTCPDLSCMSWFGQDIWNYHLYISDSQHPIDAINGTATLLMPIVYVRRNWVTYCYRYTYDIATKLHFKMTPEYEAIIWCYHIHRTHGSHTNSVIDSKISHINCVEFYNSLQSKIQSSEQTYSWNIPQWFLMIKTNNTVQLYHWIQ